MWANIYPPRNKSNENEILDIVNNSNPKDRLLLIEYISKLQLGGLSIKNKQILINFCEEAIVSHIIKLEDKNIEDNSLEIDKDAMATWYWQDKNEDGTVVLWNAFGQDENRLIECARKNKFNYVPITDGIHCIDLKSKLLIFGESNSVKIKRNPPKVQSSGTDNEIDDTTTTTTTTEDGEESINNDNDDGIEIDVTKWYWADDSKNGGHQDVWVEYSNELSRKLEIDYTTKANQQVKVDSERYVDTNKMLQVRYDCHWRVRMVKREEISRGKSSSKSPTPNKSTTSTFKKLYNLMSNLSLSKNKTTTTTTDNSTAVDIPQSKTFELKKIKLELPFVLSISQLQFVHYKIQSPPNSKVQSSSDKSNLTKYTLSTFKKAFLKNNNVTYI